MALLSHLEEDDHIVKKYAASVLVPLRDSSNTIARRSLSEHAPGTHPKHNVRGLPEHS
jgi:hypothetical protein